MADVLCLYLDDSGTRNPDHRPPKNQYRDWFGLGGILLREEDEVAARQLHAEFCGRWKISYPLHSYDIRNRTERFSWLGALSHAAYDEFMMSLTQLMTSVPVNGHACVIDRPGYGARYREKYGRQRWMLCKTAFTVLVERAAKIANQQGRRLRVFPERGDPTADDHVEAYYCELLEKGMPFETETSAKYGPLSAEDLRQTLYGLRFKAKESPMVQIADLFLYPMCRGRYQADYSPYRILQEKEKLIDFALGQDMAGQCGIKYSCFELVDAENTKAGANPGSSAASVTETS